MFRKMFILLLLLSSSYGYSATSDHSKFKEFHSPISLRSDFIQKCLQCHTEGASHVKSIMHWGGSVSKRVLQTFNVTSNPKNSCSLCHHGYGKSWHQEDAIDCLTCHLENNNMVSFPFTKSESKKLKNIYRAKVSNCGNCHFQKSIINQNFAHTFMTSELIEEDVHLKKHNLVCVSCHIRFDGEKRSVPKQLPMSVLKGNTLSCVNCHGQKPHEKGLLNSHTARVSCLGCHINRDAIQVHNKTWEGSTPDDSSPRDLKTMMEYQLIKGRDIEQHNITTDLLKCGDELFVNKIVSSSEDLLKPFLIRTQIQACDAQSDVALISLGIPGLTWDQSISRGMKFVGRPYSGKHTWKEVKSYLPISHYTAPKEKTAKCTDCHNENSVFKETYIPGRKKYPFEIFGWLAILGALLGVSGHGLIRFIRNKIMKKEEQQRKAEESRKLEANQDDSHE